MRFEVQGSTDGGWHVIDGKTGIQVRDPIARDRMTHLTAQALADYRNQLSRDKPVQIRSRLRKIADALWARSSQKKSPEQAVAPHIGSPTTLMEDV